MKFKEPIDVMQDRVAKLGVEINFLESLPVTEIRSRLIEAMKNEAQEFKDAIHCLMPHTEWSDEK